MDDGKLSYKCEKLGIDDKLYCPIQSVKVDGMEMGDTNNINQCGPTCPGGIKNLSFAKRKSQC